MGTNFYWLSDPCPTCGHGKEWHIGKSSAGWCFALHIYPEEGIETLADWQERWKVGRIRNEYGETLTPEQMLAKITERSAPLRAYDPAFLRRNHARYGPKGLLRTTYLATPGDGTYDLCVGGFE